GDDNVKNVLVKNMKKDNNKARIIEKSNDPNPIDQDSIKNHIISYCKSYKPQNENHISILCLCESTKANSLNEWIKIVSNSVLKRFIRMPRNGWSIVLEYMNKKFNQEIKIEKFRKWLNLFSRGFEASIEIHDIETNKIEYHNSETKNNEFKNDFKHIKKEFIKILNKETQPRYNLAENSEINIKNSIQAENSIDIPNEQSKYKGNSSKSKKKIIVMT
ncbi:hypothetical protein DMUE_4594, partial [Dictyocoela muelleri]